MKFTIPNWEEAVKHDMYSFAKQVEKNCPKGVLIDCSNQEHPMSPGLQAWAKEIVERPCVEAGVEKIAIVRPDDHSHWATIDVEPEKGETFHRRYFHSVADAEEWLNAD